MVKRNHGKKRTVPFRRKREGRTDYVKRLGLLKSGSPRFVVRMSNNNVVCQLVGYDADGDRVLAAASSKDLKAFGWLGHPANISSAYLVGLLAAKKALKAGVKDAILDLGLLSSGPGAKAFASLKGALDGSLSVPHSDKSLPSDDRICGKAVAEYASGLGKDVYAKQFSAYVKSGFKPEDFVKVFEGVKAKIMSI